MGEVGALAVKAFFSTPERPVTSAELSEFMKSLSKEEWEWYKTECTKAMAFRLAA